MLTNHVGLQLIKKNKIGTFPYTYYAVVSLPKQTQKASAGKEVANGYPYGHGVTPTLVVNSMEVTEYIPSPAYLDPAQGDFQDHFFPSSPTALPGSTAASGAEEDYDVLVLVLSSVPS